jgi:hypothetical protein
MTQDVETPCIANAATDPDQHEEIEITPEMIEVAAEPLWRCPLFEIPQSLAEDMAREMLELALTKRRKKIFATAPEG